MGESVDTEHSFCDARDDKEVDDDPFAYLNTVLAFNQDELSADKEDAEEAFFEATIRSYSGLDQHTRRKDTLTAQRSFYAIKRKQYRDYADHLMSSDASLTKSIEAIDLQLDCICSNITSWTGKPQSSEPEPESSDSD
ncbi:hypothetical protein DXG01_016024, partial [Tephrocybe rancida]